MSGSYEIKFLKGCLPQILLGPLLHAWSRMIISHDHIREWWLTLLSFQKQSAEVFCKKSWFYLFHYSNDQPENKHLAVGKRHNGFLALLYCHVKVYFVKDWNIEYSIWFQLRTAGRLNVVLPAVMKAFHCDWWFLYSEMIGKLYSHFLRSNVFWRRHIQNAIKDLKWRFLLK